MILIEVCILFQFHNLKIYNSQFNQKIMAKYKEKIYEKYIKIKNSKYSKEVLGGILLLGGAYTQYSLTEKVEPIIMLAASLPLDLFGLYNICSSLGSKLNEYEKHIANKKDLEKKVK